LNTKQAVAQRILELCQEHHLSVNALATMAGIPPSTVYSMLNEKSLNPGVVSIKKLCDALNITLGKFFSAPVFDELEQEIQ